MFFIASVYSVLGSLAESVLQFFNNLGFGWGVSIILATLLVRIIVSPFAWKQLKTIFLFRQLSPEVSKIRDYYDTDFDKMNKETMELYTKNRFHIFGIVVPSLLQAPFLISMFVYLNSSDFKKDVGDDKSFLFINNILEATSSHWTTLLSLVGLYLLIQLFSQIINSPFKLKGKSLLISLSLSFVFTLLLVHFSAALMIYWTFGALFLFFQQVFMKVFIKKPEVFAWQEPNQKVEVIEKKENLKNENI